MKKLLSEVNGHISPQKRIVGFLVTEDPLPKSAARVIDREALAARFLDAYKEAFQKTKTENP